VNKQFKLLLENGLKKMISNQILVEPFSVAKLCEESWDDDSMQKAIVSSWKSIGLFSFDETKILLKLKKFCVQQPKEQENKIFKQVLEFIKNKYGVLEEEKKKNHKRKKEGNKSITFRTTSTTF
jgi:hypothetical protein